MYIFARDGAVCRRDLRPPVPPSYHQEEKQFLHSSGLASQHPLSSHHDSPDQHPGRRDRPHRPQPHPHGPLTTARPHLPEDLQSCSLQF